MDDSDSSLSSTHSTDDEELIAKMTKPTGIGRYFKPAPKVEKEPSPEPPKRAPSPPHEYILADNDAIPFIVMFRSRFNDAFPKSLPHYGPQDIERGISGEYPEEHVERLLCALLSLVLNRKKDVEKGHYNRALEDALSANKHQWPAAWNGQNPLPGEKSFNTMNAEERLILLKSLILWSLNSSEAIQTILKESYKQTRRDDDKNQPKSVQPWFSDSYRRKYYLIEGIEDTYFRVYRENDGKTRKTNTWFNVAGSIEEVSALADKFEQEGTNQTKIIHDRIKAAIPRFEAGEEKRKRRDYRIARKAAFARPEPGFSLYEGRTRGKRMRYTFSDGEEDDSDIPSGRRSTRQSGYATPMENGPTVTASGRQVKSRVGGLYGESMLTGQRKELEQQEELDAEGDGNSDSFAGKSRSRVAVTHTGRGLYTDELGSDSERDAGEVDSSGKDWSGNEDESDEESEPDLDDEDEGDDDMDGIVADAEDDENTQESLVVKLSYRPGTKAQHQPSLANGKSENATTNANTNGAENGEIVVPQETTNPVLKQSTADPYLNGSEHANSTNGVRPHIPGSNQATQSDQPTRGDFTRVVATEQWRKPQETSQTHSVQPTQTQPHVQSQSTPTQQPPQRSEPMDTS